MPLGLMKSLLLPPGINLLLIAIGLLCSIRYRKTGFFLIALSFISLYLLSTPAVSNALLRSLECYPALNLTKLKTSNAQAIVMLTSGSTYAPEFGGSGPSSTSLQRAYYTALLYKTKQLPVLISGGTVSGEVTPESTQIKRLLEKDFLVPVWEIEPRSHNTYQNAQNSAAILKENGIQSFYLVTSAWHMKRALWAFQRLGYQPIPAPTDYAVDILAVGYLRWLPSPRAFTRSYLALHEYLGLAWYKMAFTA